MNKTTAPKIKSIRISRDLAGTIADKIVGELPPLDEAAYMHAAKAFRRALEPVLDNVCRNIGVRIEPTDGGQETLRPYTYLMERLGLLNNHRSHYCHHMLGVMISNPGWLSTEAQNVLCLPANGRMMKLLRDRADFDGDTTALEALRAASRTLAKAIEEFNAWYEARRELHVSIVEKLAGRSTTAVAKEIPEFARFMPVAPTGGDLVLVGPCELVQRLIAAGFKAQP